MFISIIWSKKKKLKAPILLGTGTEITLDFCETEVFKYHSPFKKKGGVNTLNLK